VIEDRGIWLIMNQGNARQRIEMVVVSCWDDYEVLSMIGAMDHEMHVSRFGELVEDW
jgi:hypothetical protein